jgi:hypothetical protein
MVQSMFGPTAGFSITVNPHPTPNTSFSTQDSRLQILNELDAMQIDLKSGAGEKNERRNYRSHELRTVPEDPSWVLRQMSSVFGW